MSSSHRSNQENLETTLESFIENVRLINIMVADFQPQAQTVLNQKIQKIVTDLRDINKFKTEMMDVQIPMEVFEYIDQGYNPQLYTKDCMSKALAKNEEAKGKIDAYKRFKANMLVKLSKTFPREMNAYRALVETRRNARRDDESDLDEL
ncbi:mediator of RNA polymerase II transcription subunit 10-like [Nasonia vitripennis]|uniref:Mediator of RNA polymerase II transcription subunit 10 n=1 Tax=Nasonia vitripennis TaxID=7425 RepID=A0A7M7GCB2_NASVI|nr:mediator of RNA polymerase II transcription subunit 10-like [Nasonia vitripennis]